MESLFLDFIKLYLKTLLFIALIHFSAYSQNIKWTSNKAFLLSCDTCKSKPLSYIDEYLIDSITNQPFTGVAVYKTDFSIDSVSFINGMKSGLSKFSYLKEKNSYTYTYFLGYGFVSNHYHLNKQTKVIFFYKTKGINYYYRIKFKKNNIVMQVKLSFDNNKQEKFKVHFNNFENYHNYFKTAIDDNLYLKMEETCCFIPVQ